jgi:glycosyltransferase involved in cell wall biosynthesis
MSSHLRTSFLVVWISSGENEAQDSLASVLSQTGVQVDVIRLEGLGQFEAHQKMFDRFREANPGTICCQVDADMVLGDSNIFRDAAKLFAQIPDLDFVQVAVRDAISQSIMVGMKFIRAGSAAEFSAANVLRPDRVRVPENRKRLVLEWADRIQHCRRPHERQAIHFGAHRMLKVISGAKRDPWNSYYLRRTAEEARQGRSQSQLAIAGAHAVSLFTERALPLTLDYASPQWREILSGARRILRSGPQALESSLARIAPKLGFPEGESETEQGQLKWLLYLPHLELYGGVLRLLYLGRELKRMGDEVTVGVGDLSSRSGVVDGLVDEWNLQTCSKEDSQASRFDVLVVGDVNGETIDSCMRIDAKRKVLLALAGGKNYQRKYEFGIQKLEPDLTVSVAKSIAAESPYPMLKIPGGVDTEVFFPNNVVSSWDGTSALQIATHFGRGKSFKGFPEAFELCTRIRELGIPVHLTVVSAVGISSTFPDWVELRVGLEPRQVARILRDSHVAISWESRSGWANFSIQALASGCIVLGNGTGAEDFAESFSNYIRLDPKDPLEVIAEAIVRGNFLSQERMGAEAVRAAAEKYSWARWSRELRSVTREIIGFPLSKDFSRKGLA